jgi:hypothetical protein
MLATPVFEELHVADSFSKRVVPSLELPISISCAVEPSCDVVMVSGLVLSCSDTSVAVETAAAPVVVIPAGPLPAANGEPLTAVSTPLVPLIASATTEPGSLLSVI